MTTMRFDRAEFKAKKTAEGYIDDIPIITRAGVFEYREPDGSVIRELRHPDDVFKADSLETLKGQIITVGHVKQAVDSKTAKQVGVGMVLTKGWRDDAEQDKLRAEIRVFDPTAVEQAGLKELSCGYSCVVIPESGIYEGQPYDRRQTEIKYNHLAIVGKGRAGVAKFNMDAAENYGNENDITKGILTMSNNLVSIRLDSGIAYETQPEVAAAYEALKADHADVIKTKSTLEAERDSLKAELQAKADAEDQIKADAFKAAKERIQLEATAKSLGVHVKADSDDITIRKDIVKTLRPAIKLDGKDDNYINAMFDIAILEQADNKKAFASQKLDAADEPVKEAAVKQANIFKF